MLRRRAWELTAPGQGRVVEETLPEPGDGQLLLQAEWGALSPGSEALVFSGGLPAELSLDDTIADMAGDRSYPLRYGYILTGTVTAAASTAAASTDAASTDAWNGRRVYAFHPHATAAVVNADSVIPVPDFVQPRQAPLYANVETALSLHWDAGILPGESVVVVGAGVVGLLTTLLAVRRAASLVVLVERDPERRRWAGEALGSDAIVVAEMDEAARMVREHPTAVRGTYPGFDVGFELSGAPAALRGLVAAIAFGGRVVLGSWYGNRPVELDLGGRFHRARISIISSQVSTIPLPVAGRIDHERRGRMVWELLNRLPVDSIPQREISLDELGTTLSACAAGQPIEPLILIRY